MNMRNKQAGWILLVEDDHQDAEKMGEFLVQHGYTVDYANGRADGLKLAMCQTYDVIVLDQKLADIDGIAVCRQFFRQTDKPPSVLMLMDRDTLENKLAGLAAGAEGYLLKPFDIRELEARLRALIRRLRPPARGEVLCVGDMTLDPLTSRVIRGGKELSVSSIGLRLLAILMRESPHAVSRHDIEREIWGHPLPDPDMFYSYVYSLRLAIDKSFDQPLFHKLGATGYCVADQSASADIGAPVPRPRPISQDQTDRFHSDKDGDVKEIEPRRSSKQPREGACQQRIDLAAVFRSG
jgi:DNA-binding response OmpR family regulator